MAGTALGNFNQLFDKLCRSREWAKQPTRMSKQDRVLTSMALSEAAGQAVLCEGASLSARGLGEGWHVIGKKLITSSDKNSVSPRATVSAWPPLGS